jgi:hypothetical protein
VALGAAGGAAYLLNLIRPVFYNSRTLADVIGLPVIGPVGRTWTAQTRLRERLQMVALSGAAILLLAAYAFAVIKAGSIAPAVTG